MKKVLFLSLFILVALAPGCLPTGRRRLQSDPSMLTPTRM